MTDPIHIISLGAGVQSSTMALMAAKGELTPMPIASVFADTQDEPASVYAWLNWLEGQLPFPVFRVTKGSLSTKCTEVRWSEKSQTFTITGIPAFVKNGDGSIGLMSRQCTRDFKIDPCTKDVNRLRRESGNCRAVLWLGISSDEVYRAKSHRNSPRIENRFPLIDTGMSRRDCLVWMARHGYPQPPRSACVYCPYKSNNEWRRLKASEPTEFAKAVAFEVGLQLAASKTQIRGVPFLHRSLMPLSEVDLSTEEERGQLNMFNNECEGMCGV